MSRGLFITLEGGEGVGKSTQLQALARRLGPYAPRLVLTREPGGSEGAERLRELLVRGEADRWSPLSEALILAAARCDHLERTVRPALDAGAWVLSDRFADSTRAYQGAGGGVPAEVVAALEAMVVADARPDLTVILDLPAEVGLERALARGGDARFERKALAFHQRLRQAFLDIAAAEPARCRVVNAGGTPTAVEARIWEVAAERLSLKPSPAGAP